MPHPFKSFFLVALLFSCSQQSSNSAEQKSDSIPLTSVDSSSHANNPSETDSMESTADSAEVRGMVFFIGGPEAFAQQTCSLQIDCDCCSAILYLLAEDQFVFVDECLSGNTYFSGSYSLSSQNLKLNFSKSYVNVVVDDQNDYEFVELKKEKLKDDRITNFQIEPCNGSMHLIDTTSEYYTHGVRRPVLQERKLISELLKSDEYKFLQQH